MGVESTFWVSGVYVCVYIYIWYMYIYINTYIHIHMHSCIHKLYVYIRIIYTYNIYLHTYGSFHSTLYTMCPEGLIHLIRNELGAWNDGDLKTLGPLGNQCHVGHLPNRVNNCKWSASHVGSESRLYVPAVSRSSHFFGPRDFIGKAANAANTSIKSGV